MKPRYLIPVIAATVASLAIVACSGKPEDEARVSVSSLSQVPAVRLNYRYEADVPPPDPSKDAIKEERNQAVQADFDANRPQEVLDKTFTSPDANRVAAVYHKSGDAGAEFRLDMYASDGRPLKKVTSDEMAVHFPDTIRWAPDSSALAFVAMVRGITIDETAMSPATDPESSIVKPPPDLDNGIHAPSPDSNSNSISADANSSADAPAPLGTPEAPTGILTFRTEQIYLCNPDGDGARAITQNEGLIYFYFVWAPDSTALAALAAKSIEWKYLEDRANFAGEVFVPFGRPRVVEKNGRERRLDDALTSVQPVWSPDAYKVACAFDNQVRIYDGAGDTPTQAAIPLRNHLLLSAQAYDREQAAKLKADANSNANAGADENANANSNVNPNSNATSPGVSDGPGTTLPDEKSLVSYNPIVALNWTADELLYFQTAYLKRMKNEADSVTSFQRWHRLVLTPQPAGR